MRYVLVTIADAANRDGLHAHPGMEAMVEGSLYSRATVNRTLTRLIEDGWIEVEHLGGGRGRATVYRVMMVDKPAHGEPVSEPVPDEKPRHSITETASSETETASLPYVKSAATVLATEKLSTDNSLREISHAPILELVSDQASDDQRSGFAHFWEIYPRRKGKGAARKAWKAATKKLSVDELIRATEAFRDDPNRPQGDERKWICAPATWLNQERWEDEPEPPRGHSRTSNNLGVIQRAAAFDAAELGE